MKAQATVRMALAKAQYKRQKCDGRRFVLIPPDDPKFWFRFEKVDRTAMRDGCVSYRNPKIEKVLNMLGPFKYGDPSSEQMLSEMN